MARNFDDIKDENRGLFSKRTEELYRQRQDRIDQQSVAQYRIAEQIAQNQKKVQEVLDRKYRDKDKQMEELTQLGLQYKALENLSQQIDNTSRYAAQKQFVSSMHTSLGSKAVTHGIASVERSSQNLGASLSMARGMSTFQLEEQEREARAAAERMRPKIMEAVEHVDEPGGKARLDYLSSQQDKHVRKAGLAGAAISAQKKLGIDISSRYFDAGKTMSEIQRDQQTEQIREDVTAGRVGSKADVQRNLKLAADRLAAVFDKLSSAIANTDDKAKDLGEEFAKLEDEYKKHQQTLKEMDRQGIGGEGGGFVGRLKEAGGIINDIGTITQAAAQGYRVVNITSEMQQTQNRIGYAQLANQRFENVYGATQGDMAALRRVLSRQYEEQARRGAEYRDREQLAVGGETLGRGGQLVGRVLDAATSVEAVKQGATGGLRGGLAGAAIGYGAQVSAKAAPDALEFNRLLTDYRKDISAGRTDIQAQNQFRQLQDAISKISDFSSQRTFDYYKDLTLATRGLGLGANLGPTSMKTYQGTGMMGRNANAAARMLDTGAALDYNPEPEKDQELARISAYRGGELDGVNFSGAWKALKKLFSDDSDLVSPTSGSRSVSATPSPFGRKVLTRGTTQQSAVSSTGTVGGGGDRELVMSTLMNKDIIDRLSDEAGLGLKDIPRVIGGFRRAIGKELTGGLTGQAGIDTLMGNVTRAGQLARVGYLESPEQYIQARGQLTDVGGDKEDFEKILRQAVAAGMDSSKNIMEMVGAVSEMNQRSASLGIDSAAAATNILGRSFQDLQASGVKESIAVRAAQLGAQTAEAFTTSTDLDLYNVSEFSQLRTAFEGAEWWELDAIARASNVDLEELSRLQGTKGKEKEAKEFAIKKGLATRLTDKTKTDKALNISTGSAIDRLLSMGLNEGIVAEIRKAQEGGLLPSEMSDKARTYMSWAGIKVGTSGEATAASLQYRRSAAEKEAETDAQGKFVAGGEKAIQTGAISDAKVFADGVRNFSEAIGGIQQVGEIMKSISEKGLNLQGFKDDVAESAKEMQAPLTQFTGNIDLFNQSIKNFDTKMKLLIDKVDAVMQKQMLNVPSIDSQGTKGKIKHP